MANTFHPLGSRFTEEPELESLLRIVCFVIQRFVRPLLDKNSGRGEDEGYEKVRHPTSSCIDNDNNPDFWSGGAAKSGTVELMKFPWIEKCEIRRVICIRM